MQAILTQPQQQTDDSKQAAALWLLLLLAPSVQAHPYLLPVLLRRVTTPRGLTLTAQLQARFDLEVTTLADRAAAGTLPLGIWQVLMAHQVAVHIQAQTMLGARSITDVSSDPVARIAAQLPFLFNFHADLQARQAAGKLSADYIANRAMLYGGSGRAAFFAASESRESRQTGWVAMYEARDDKGTCSPCLAAEAGSPYRVGQGPFPGGICLGRGRCRCIRRLVHDRAAYQQLGGGP